MDALLRIKADVQGENNIKKLGNSLQGLQGRAKNAALGFNSLKGAVAGFGAAIVGSAIVGGLGAMVKSAVDLGDEFGKMSARTGVAQGALIGLRNAAKLSDVENEKLQAGLTRLNVAMVAAAEGNAAAETKFKRLGISVKNAAGEVRPTDQVFKDLGDRFKDMPDGAQKAAAAVSIFGKAGADLIPLLNGGREAMEAFNYELSDEFAARSELFNDTLTIIGFKTEGFKLQLADALLPALQSILEVFGDLFDTKNDWTALFEVIKLGLRSVATVIFATIKLVDVLIKATFYSFDAIGKTMRGDFAGAGEALSQGFGAGLEQAKRDFALIQKLFTDAPISRTIRDRPLDLDTRSEDAKVDAADKKRLAAEKQRQRELEKQLTEAERLQEKQRAFVEKVRDIASSVSRKVEDASDALLDVGASPVQQIINNRQKALTDSKRIVADLIKEKDELLAEGLAINVAIKDGFIDSFITNLSIAQDNLDDATRDQGFKDQLPTLDSYKEKLAELTSSKKELTEVEKLNLQINSDQLGKLEETNPALAKHISDLREQALLIDQTTQKQKDAAASFGVNFNASITSYYDSINNLGADVGSAVIGTLQGLGDQLANFVTTGKLNFTDLANSIIKDMIRITTQQMIIKPILGAIGNIFPGGGGVASGTLAPTDIFKYVNNAQGNLYAQNGIQPFARGGIVNSPTLFPFAKGTGLMGEAGPEAIIPLRRGRDGNLGVAGGGRGATSVVVNVDAKGSNVEGDAPRGQQLGRALSQAVQAELLKQKRPGGLLS